MKKIAQNAGRHFLLVLLSLFAIFPLYWMIISSLKGQGEIFNYALLPESFQLGNYIYAFQEMPIVRMLCNSIINSTVQMTLQLLSAVLVAYALMR